MSQKSTYHHIRTVLILECLLGHYFAKRIVEWSVPDNVSQSYDLWDAPRRAIRPCSHALFMTCGLSATPMTAAHANPPHHLHPQMAYANNALQREIRACDCPLVYLSGRSANGVNRVVFIASNSHIRIAIRPPEGSLSTASW